MPFWKRCSQSSNNYYCYKWLCVIDQHSVKMAGYWPSSILRGQYPAVFTKQAWVSEHRICFILLAHRFNHKIVINNVIILYWPGVRLRWLDICIFIDPAFLSQGCALRKIEGSPALWTCEIQCAQQMISMKKQRFSSCPTTKVTDVGATGHRAQPGLGQ